MTRPYIGSKQVMLRLDICKQLDELKEIYNLKSYTKIIELLLGDSIIVQPTYYKIQQQYDSNAWKNIWRWSSTQD